MPYTPNKIITDVTGTLVAAATSTTTLLGAEPHRKMVSIYNDSTAIMFMKLGGGAATNEFTIRMAADSFYELPEYGIYTGSITAVWTAATGSAQVAQFTGPINNP